MARLVRKIRIVDLPASEEVVPSEQAACVTGGAEDGPFMIPRQWIFTGGNGYRYLTPWAPITITYFPAGGFMISPKPASPSPGAPPSTNAPPARPTGGLPAIGTNSLGQPVSPFDPLK